MAVINAEYSTKKLINEDIPPIINVVNEIDFNYNPKPNEIAAHEIKVAK